MINFTIAYFLLIQSMTPLLLEVENNATRNFSGSHSVVDAKG